MKSKIKCDYCGNKFEKENKYIAENKRNHHKNYCSDDCCKKSKFNGKISKCVTCGDDVYRTNSQMKRSKTGNVYCSKSCATITNNTLFKRWENHPGYKKGEASYRSKAFNHYKHKCALCAYNNIRILEVHHIDGNRSNNKVNNLIILCPTHHKEVGYGITSIK